MALPLFEEANRTRAFAATLCRELAERGIASVLPDLPGQGESLIATAAATLENWRSAFAAAAGNARYSVAIRSGALLDTAADLTGRWHFAPQAGSDVVRQLRRIQMTGDQPTTADPATIAGNRIAQRMFADLQAALPTDATRTVRLVGDAGAADRHVAGTPLWRRAEPGNDLPLAALLAADIAHWIAACEQ
jgi:hypothetical protein